MTKQAWPAKALSDHYASLDNIDGAHMQQVLDWAVANHRFVESEAKAPLFSIAGKKDDRLFAVFSSGHVYVWFEPFRYPGGDDERTQLADELKSADLMKANFDVSAVKEGKTMSRKLGDLTGDEVSNMLELIGRYCL